jgi:hypothetical protein
MKDKPFPIFICGYPKAGTTLMLSLLDRHNELLVIPQETKFFSKVLRQKGQQNKIDFLLHHTNLKMLKNDIVRGPSGIKDFSKFDYSIFHGKFYQIWNQSAKNDKDILETLVEAIAQTVKSKKYIGWVEKTPGTEFRLPIIKKWWPDAKILYLVRDPRQNFCSHKRYQNHKKKPLEISLPRFVDRWKKSFCAIERYLDFNSNGLLIRYEDLIEDTNTTMQVVSQFLGIRFDPVLLEPTRFGIEWKGNASDGSEKKNVQKNPNNYFQYLSKNEIAVIDLKFRKQLKSLQYETNIEYSHWQKLSAYMHYYYSLCKQLMRFN